VECTAYEGKMMKGSSADVI